MKVPSVEKKEIKIAHTSKAIIKRESHDQRNIKNIRISKNISHTCTS